MVDPNSRQVGGEHYGGKRYQHWDLCADAPLNYFEACVTKYVARWRQKEGARDVEKAQHFLDKLIKLYQDNRLELPVTQRLMFPLKKYQNYNELGMLELAIFRGMLTYTTLNELMSTKKLLAELFSVALRKEKGNAV
jgi:hypothetical protein